MVKQAYIISRRLSNNPLVNDLLRIDDFRSFKSRPRVKVYMCVKMHQEEGKGFRKQKRAYRPLNYIGLDVPTLMVLAIASMYSVIPYVFHGHASVSKFS
jgi:hypothetical protein